MKKKKSVSEDKGKPFTLADYVKQAKDIKAKGWENTELPKMIARDMGWTVEEFLRLADPAFEGKLKEIIEWKDEDAARRYRLMQADKLIAEFMKSRRSKT